MAGDNKFQLSQSAAENYEAHSVPALFLPLARATLERLNLPPNGHVLDVACGTGALGRVLAEMLPGRGRIAGTDQNVTMIEVARRQMPDTAHDVDWVAADVTDMPFDDHVFDLALIQQGLQFFPDKPAALAEVRRVLKPGGQLALTCWRAVSPFNGALSEALGRHVSDAAAIKAKAPFSFRDGDVIRNLLETAGFRVRQHEGIILQRNFGALRDQVMALPTEADLRAKGDAVIETVLAEMAADLEPFRRGDAFIVPQEAHFFSADVV